MSSTSKENRSLIVQDKKTGRFITRHEGESMTETHHTEACDVHNIMDKYTKTRDASLLARVSGFYGDMVDAPTYTEAMEQVANANSLFEELPSDVRADCKNDPAIFLEKMEDPEYAQGVFGESKEALERLASAKQPEQQPVAESDMSSEATVEVSDTPV